MPEPLFEADFTRPDGLYHFAIYRDPRESAYGRRILVTAPDGEACDTGYCNTLAAAERRIRDWLDTRPGVGSTAEMAE
jgi:hypothetical protein